MAQTAADRLSFIKITDASGFPDWAPRDTVAAFFHETMKPYNDSLAAVQSALDYGLVPGKGAGGFLMLSPYVDKVVVPPIDEFARSVRDEDLVEVPPSLEAPEPDES